MHTDTCVHSHPLPFRILPCTVIFFLLALFFTLFFCLFVCLVPPSSTLLCLEALLRYLITAAWQPLLTYWRLTGLCVWRENFQWVSLSKAADLNTVKSDVHLLKSRGLINMPLLYCPLIQRNLSTHNLPIIMFLQNWSVNRTSRVHLK